MRNCVRIVRAGVIVGSLLSGFACGGDATSPSPALTSATVYWALQLPQHAVTLSLTPPQNTIQLAATPFNADGQPLSGLGRPHYTTSDSALAVDSTGNVTARFTTGSRKAFVVASLTDVAQRVTLVDTCFIRVTATAPTAPLATFSIHTASGKVAASPLGTSDTMTVSETDSIGSPIATPFVYFRSSDSSIARIDPFTGVVSTVRTGVVTLSATTWSYGVAKSDSLQFTVGIPNQATVTVLTVYPTGSTTPVLTFWPQTVIVRAGSVVTWSNASFTDSADVVFDDPTHVDSAAYPNVRLQFGSGEGNIAPWMNDLLGSNPITAQICTKFGGRPPGSTCTLALRLFPFAKQRLRTFPVAGTYHYRSQKWGTDGTIIVQ